MRAGRFEKGRAAPVILLSLLATEVIAGESVVPDFPSRVYWGDTHVHTLLSGDAYTLGTRLTPDDAYRFAKGESIRTAGGREAQLRRPLDFLLVADHAENLGVLPRLAANDESVPTNETSEKWRNIITDLPPLSDILNAETVEEFREKSALLYAAKEAKGADYSITGEFQRTVWQGVVETAEKYYEPGTFTTFAGYEWSANDGKMIHRNVLFADGPEVTGRIVPFSAFDSHDVEDLWAWLEIYEREHGGSAISIPHNGNISGGSMFALRTFGGDPLSRTYAASRARWEPIYEVTQIKGDGETHPLLSPDDEFADFETWPPKVFGGAAGGEEFSYARSALRLGLQQESTLGANPFKFGMIGSTDSHTALATADEDLFWGKMGLNEPSQYRSTDLWFYSASGYAAVWAEENTRESLFAAMRRKETYATTGPRLVVRFFGGWDYEAGDALADDFAQIGYEKGVPMGGDLAHAPEGRAPRFIVHASKDPDGAELQRLQIIKGWLDKTGESHERVFDIASMGEEDVSGVLATLWQDPEFDEHCPAFYYVRVLEVPTPRWTAYDSEYFELNDLPEEVPMIIQERAYTSPIWYTP